ncbi:MAG: glycosyltransferase [Desulfitobacterium hafniense]|nr:glycosyltransferase [Desulfitobacterium hafniense]
MKVAVLMSTYNGEKYLDAQLESIANQTISKYISVYIRDDGSTDDTLNIIIKWKAKMPIHVFCGANIGPAMSFWTLLEEPNIDADYYAFCDQDDVWDKDKIEASIRCLTHNPNCHMTYCNCRIIDSEGNILNSMRCLTQPSVSIPFLFVSGVTQGCSMTFTRELRDYIQRKKIQCVPMHDVIVMLYALDFASVYYDKKPHFSYRVHNNNVVAKNNKSTLNRMKTTYWNWKNSSRYSMETVALEMLHKCENLSEQDKCFLSRMSKYKTKLKDRLALAFDNSLSSISLDTLRSYRIRLLLKLL